VNDEIVGTAVLEGDHLSVVCYSPATKRVLVETIRAYPRGTPKPEDPAWAYWMENDRLCATPSLHLRIETSPGTWHTIFHNGGQWSVPYQRVDSNGVQRCLDINSELIESLKK
jgi:hypothetical protein